MSNLSSNLHSAEHWHVRDRSPEPIDLMDLRRVVALLTYLEQRYRLSAEERAQYSTVQSAPLYQSLQSRLPIATAEHAAKAERIRNKERAINGPTTVPQHKGHTLDELNAAAGQKKEEEPEPISSKSMLSTGDAAIALGLTQSTVASLAASGQISGATKDANGHWMLPTEEVAKLKDNEPTSPIDGRKLSEQRTATREKRTQEVADKISAPIMATLDAMAAGMREAFGDLSKNQGTLLDGMNAQHIDMVNVISAVASTMEERHRILLERVDALESKLQEIHEDVVVPKKGKKR